MDPSSHHAQNGTGRSTVRLSQIKDHIAASGRPSQQQPSAPCLILIFGWTAAPLAALQRYTKQYNDLFPKAKVQTFAVTLADLLPWPQCSSSWSRRGLEELIAATETDPSGVLVHIFSGGGAARFGTVASLYRQSTGRSLPISMLLCDSAPADSGSISRARVLNDSILFGQSPWIVKELTRPVLIAALVTSYAWTVATFQEEPTQRGWDCLLDPVLVPRSAVRCYVYSTIDRIIPPDYPERHIKLASEQGLDVLVEKFTDSNHVSHAKRDPERYWGLVKRAWLRASETPSGNVKN